MAVAATGQLYHSTIGQVREQNWNQILRALREDLRIGPGARILEVGAGDGTNLRALAARSPEFSWRGVDLVPRDAVVLPGDATSLPFSAGAFAAIVTYNALEQMPGEVVNSAWNEFARVARVGAVCVEPDFMRGRLLQKLSMLRKDYIREIVRPALSCRFSLVRREWTIGGNPFNRPSLFVFRAEKP